MTTPLVRLDDSELLAAIDRTLALLQQPYELMNDIGAKIEKKAHERWDTKTDPNGDPWAPLSPATKDIYESDWFIARNSKFNGGIPGTLLDRTNELRGSLTHNTGDDYTEIGTSRPQGAWQIGWLHETGTTKMPRRGILTANPKTGELGAGDRDDVLGIVNGALRGTLFG